MALTTGPATVSGLCSRATVLASLLSRPVEDPLLWQVRDEYFASQWGPASAYGQRGLALLRESAAAREDVERLARDFERLFGGDHPRLQACQSTHEAGVTATQLETLYRSRGVNVIEHLPADHLANELYYASQLHLVTDAEALLRSFTLEHLKWAGQFFAEIALRAGSLFYQGVGALGVDYIESAPAR